MVGMGLDYGNPPTKPSGPFHAGAAGAARPGAGRVIAKPNACSVSSPRVPAGSCAAPIVAPTRAPSPAPSQENAMKRNLMWLAASAAALGAGMASAQTYYPPQPGYGYGSDDGYGQGRTVRCESRDSRTARCRIDGAGDVRMTRQLSRH